MDVEMSQAHKVPCAPVKTLDEVVTDPNVWERGFRQHVQHPELASLADGKVT